MLLLLLLLVPDILVVGQLMIVIRGYRVVLVKRFLIRRRVPVDRKFSHDRLISGTL